MKFITQVVQTEVSEMEHVSVSEFRRDIHFWHSRRQRGSLLLRDNITPIQNYYQ
jgi:hypothetical protein